MSMIGGSAVDSKVVELRMENQQFESGAEKSLSTIEKLHKSLSLIGDTKGIDSIGSSLKNVKFDALTSGVDTARRGFSLLETVTFGFFSSLGSRLEQTAEQFARLVTGIDPLIDGFSEYELKMDSVQTILMGAKTADGLPVTLDMVNQKLEELNAYSDKTIYSFRDMTANIGKFTNAGVDLDTAVAAIQGISNEAALSGANANEASRAMYNFSQALSAGYVKLIDWKSIENANMATVEFKQTLIDTAVELGTVKEAGDGLYEGLGTGQATEAFNATTQFNNALANQWMTSEVLTTALAKYADETTSIGRRAFEAATKVKTFSQLMDTLKEAAGSGWAQTFEILIGDFEEARSFFTFLSNEIGGVIGGMAEERNNFLKAAFEAPPKIIDATMWDSLNLSTKEADALYKALINVGESYGYAFGDVNTLAAFKMSLEEGWLTADMLKEALGGVGEAGEGAAGGIEKIQEAALAVIRGDYGNDMEARFKQLEEAGLDPQLVQDYVNTVHELAGGTWNITDAMLEQANAQYEAQAGLSALSDEELKAMGYTESQIETLRKLAEQLEKSGTAMNKVADDSDQISNRTKIIMSLQGIIRNFIKLGGLVKEVFESIFPPATTDTVTSFADGFVSLAAAFNQFVNNALAPGSAVRNILSGIFSVLRVGTTIIGSVIKVIFDLRNKVVSFILPIAISVLGFIGKIVTGISQVIVILNPLQRAIDLFKGVGNAIKNSFTGAFESLKNSTKLDTIAKRFRIAGVSMRGFIPYVEMTGKKWNDFTQRLSDKGGLSYAFSSWDAFKETVGDFKTSVIDYFLKFPGFTQLATAFKTLGESVRQELIERGFPVEKIEGFFGTIWGWVSGKGNAIKSFFANIFNSAAIRVDLQTIQSAFGRTWDNILDLIERLKAAWETFTQKVSDMGGFKLSNIGNIFKAFAETVLPELTSKDIFAPIKSAFKFLFSDIDTIFGESFGFNFKSIKATITGWIDSIKEVVSGFSLKDIFSGFFGGSEEKEVAAAVEKSGGNIFTRAFKGLASLFGPTTVYADELDESLTGADIGDKIITLSQHVNDAAPAIESGVGTITTCFKQVGDAADAVATAVGGEGKGAGEVIFGFFDWLKKAMSGVQNVLGPIGTVVAALLTFKGVGAVADSIGNMINGIRGAEAVTAELNKAKAKELKAKALLEIAAAIGVLAGALFLVSKVKDPGNALKILAGMAAGLLLFGFLLSRMKAENIGKGTRGLLELSIAIAILAGVAFLISFVGWQRALKGAVYIGVLLLGLVGVVKLLTKVGGDGKAVAGAGAGLLAIASAIAILTGIMILLSFMDWGTFGQSLVKLVAIIGLLLGAVLAMAAISKYVGAIKQTQKMLLGLAAVIAVIAGAMFLMSLIAPDRLIPVGIALGVLMGIAAAMMVAGSKLDPSAFKPIAAVVAMIAVIAISLVALATVNPGRLGLATGILAGMLAAIIVLVVVLNKAKHVRTGSIIALTVMIAAIGGVIGLLATLTDTDAALKAAESMALVMGAVAVLAVALSSIKNVSFIAGVKIIGLIAVIALIGVIAGAIISNMDPDDQAKAMKALDAGIEFMEKIGEMLGALVGGVVAGFSKAAFDPSVAETIVAFMEALVPLSDLPPLDFSALGSAIGAVMLISAAGYVDSILSLVSEFTQGKSAAQSFSDDLVAIAGAFAVWSETLELFEQYNTAQGFNYQAFNDAAALVVKISFAGLVASVNDAISEWLTGKSAIDTFTEHLTAISEAFNNWKATLDKFKDGVPDISPLYDAIRIIEEIPKSGGIYTAISGLLVGQPDFEAFKANLTALGECLALAKEKLGGIGEFTFSSAPLEEIVKALEEIPKEGGVFPAMKNILTGHPSFKTFDSNIEALGSSLQLAKEKLSIDFTFDKEKITNITDALNELPKEGNIFTAIKNLIKGHPSFDTFNANIIALGGSLQTAKDNLAQFDGFTFNSEPITSIQDALDKIPGDGLYDTLKSFLTGAPDFAQFNQDIISLGHSLELASSRLGNFESFTFDGAVLDSITEAIAAVPKTGGFFSAADAFINGEVNFESFDEKIVGLAHSLKLASIRLSNLGLENFDLDVNTINTVAQAIAAVPTEGGLLDAIGAFVFGEQDFDEFATNCEGLGKALTAFANNLGTMDSSKLSTAADASVAISKVMDSISRYGDSLSRGSTSLSSLGGELETYGEGLQSFTEKISDVDATEKAAKAAKNLATACATFSEVTFDGSDLANSLLTDTFKQNIDKLVATFEGLDGKTFPGVDRLKTAVDTLNETELNNPETTTTETTIDVKVNTSGAEDAGKAMTTSFETGASGMASAASSAAKAAADAIRSSAGEFASIGTDLMSQLGAGISNNAGYPSAQARNAVGYAIAAASSAASGASEAGLYFATGFADGISNHTYFMTAAARIATRAAINASKAEEDANSPAKETYKLGKWFVQGYANAITDYTYLAVNASTDLVSEAKDGLENAGNMINSLLTDDMDTAPTITPVLDLSEIQNGANGISKMLNGNTVDVTGISGSVARRATNGDILSALTALRGSVESGRNGDTYVINGITYDDGTNVSNAVASLVRAVRMERRA